MAISENKSGSNAGSSGTASVSLAADSTGETAIMFVNWDSADTFSSLTVGGSSTGVTQIGSEFAAPGGRVMRAYRLYNPPTASSAYTVTVTGSDLAPQIFITLYFGVAQNGPIDSTNTGSAATAAITLSTTVVAPNCWLVSYYAATGSGINNNAAGTGTTIRQTISSTSIGDSNTTVGTGSQSMGWIGARTNSAGFIFSMDPVGAAATSIKTVDGVAKASVKTVVGVAIASVKAIDGLA